MKYYIEVTLMGNDEFSPYELWSQFYPQLHLALAEMKNVDNKVNIGFSFPQYHFHSDKGIGFLGTKLRIFSNSDSDLQKLDLVKWIVYKNLNDYVHISLVRGVPLDKVKGYAIYKRKQVKTNAQRLARHRVKRGDIGFDEALARYSQVVTTTNLPYIEMQSFSTSDKQSKKRFKLFIEKIPANKSETQVFSTYGLSSESSVPEF